MGSFRPALTGVADEVQIEDLLQRRAEKLDVGSLAGR
jgi:hypothetical protein